MRIHRGGSRVEGFVLRGEDFVFEGFFFLFLLFRGFGFKVSGSGSPGFQGLRLRWIFFTRSLAMQIDSQPRIDSTGVSHSQETAPSPWDHFRTLGKVLL